jgi:hypothetical protein
MKNLTKYLAYFTKYPVLVISQCTGYSENGDGFSPTSHAVNRGVSTTSLAADPVDGGYIIHGFTNQTDAEDFAKISDGEVLDMSQRLNELEEAKRIRDEQYIHDFAGWNKMTVEQARTYLSPEAAAERQIKNDARVATLRATRKMVAA